MVLLGKVWGRIFRSLLAIRLVSSGSLLGIYSFVLYRGTSRQNRTSLAVKTTLRVAPFCLASDDEGVLMLDISFAT